MKRARRQCRCSKAVHFKEASAVSRMLLSLHLSSLSVFFSYVADRRYAILFIKTPVPLPCRQLCTCSPELHAMLVGPWSKECTQGGDMRRGGGDKAPACTNPKSSAKKREKTTSVSLSYTTIFQCSCSSCAYCDRMKRCHEKQEA